MSNGDLGAWCWEPILPACAWLFAPLGRDRQKVKSKVRVHSSEEQKDCLALERRGVLPYFLLGKTLVWLLPRLFLGMACALFSVPQCM